MFTWFRGNHCKQVLRPFSSSEDTNPIHPLSPESLSQGWHTRIFLWRWTLSPSFRSSSRYLPDNKMIVTIQEGSVKGSFPAISVTLSTTPRSREEKLA